MAGRDGTAMHHPHLTLFSCIVGMNKPKHLWSQCAYNQKYSQYCSEFHDQLWEALSGTVRGVPSCTRGERILEMLWSLQMPWIIGFGGSQPYSRGEFQEKLWERFRGLPGIFPEFPPESPSRTGGVAYLTTQKLNKRQTTHPIRAQPVLESHVIVGWVWTFSVEIALQMSKSMCNDTVNTRGKREEKRESQNPPPPPKKKS